MKNVKNLAAFGQDYPIKMAFTTASSNFDIPSEAQNEAKSSLNEEYEAFLYSLNHPSFNTSFSKSMNSPKSELQERGINKVRVVHLFCSYDWIIVSN